MSGHTPWSEIKRKRDNEPGIEERRAAARADLERELDEHAAKSSIRENIEAHREDLEPSMRHLAGLPPNNE